jgi:hypothetical protein
MTQLQKKAKRTYAQMMEGTEYDFSFFYLLSERKLKRQKEKDHVH